MTNVRIARVLRVVRIVTEIARAGEVWRTADASGVEDEGLRPHWWGLPVARPEMRSRQTLRLSTSRDESNDPANVVFGYDSKLHVLRLCVRMLNVAQLLSLILQARPWVF
jgi:hypothetical protein